MKIDYWQKFEYGKVYHIYNRAVSNRNLFESEGDHIRFLKYYNKYFNTYFDTLAYCLMPNHFHILVRVKTQETILSNIQSIDSNILVDFTKGNARIDEVILDFTRRWFSSHAIYLNRRLDIRGPLFMKRFKRVSVYIERRLKYIITYIHHNPIHHKFRNRYEDWKFSSYNDYFSVIPPTGNPPTNPVGLGSRNHLGVGNPSFLDRQTVLTEFGSLEKLRIYHELFQVDYREAHHLDE